MRLSTFRLAAALALALALFPTPAYGTPYPIVFDAFASCLHYTPLYLGNSLQTWNATFTDSPWSEWSNGSHNVPRGLGFRIVRLPDYPTSSSCTGSDCQPRMDLSFYANGIEVWGFWGDPGDDGTGGRALLLDEKNNALAGGDGRANGAFTTGTPKKLLEWKVETALKRPGLLPMSGTVAVTHAVVYMEIHGR